MKRDAETAEAIPYPTTGGTVGAEVWHQAVSSDRELRGAAMNPVGHPAFGEVSMATKKKHQHVGAM